MCHMDSCLRPYTLAQEAVLQMQLIQIAWHHLEVHRAAVE